MPAATATPFATLTRAGQARRHRATAATALKAYGVAGARIRQIALDTNAIFRVDTVDGQRFAVRVQHNGLHGRGQTDVEAWWVRRLAADGLPVANVVPNVDGGLTTTVAATDLVPEDHVCLLFEWLPGSLPDDEPLAYWSAAGELAARLHQHSIGLTPPGDAEPRRWASVFPYAEPILFASEAAEVLGPEGRRVGERARAMLDEHLTARYSRPDGYRLLHGDLHDGNLMSRRGQLSVFDFEDHIVGDPAHDLAVMLYGPYYNRDDLADVVAATRQGYERVAPWPIERIEDLSDLMAARALGLANFCLTMGPEMHKWVHTLLGRVSRYLDTGA